MAASIDPRTGIMRGAAYAVFLLTVVNIFNYMDRMVLAVLAQPIKEELGLSDSQLGILTGFAFVAVYAAVGLPLARLADRIGRRWVLAGSLAMWSVMTAASGLVRSFSQLALARVGVGIGEAGGMPSSHALLAEIYPPGRRAVPIAIMTAGAAIGITLGLSIGGLIANAYGWRAAFMIVGLPGMVLAILVAFTLPEPARPPQAERVKLPFWQTLQRLFQIRTYRWLVCTHPFYSFVTAGVVGWLPTFFIRTHGMRVDQVGAFFGIAFGFGIVTGGLLGAWVLERVSRTKPQRSLFYAGLLMLTAFPAYVAALLIANQWMALTLMMVFGALTGGAGAPMIAGQQGVVGNQVRATASAVSVFFSAYIGGGLGPLLIGMGSDFFTASLGPNALRASLLIASLAIILPGFFMIRASRSFVADAEAVR